MIKPFNIEDHLQQLARVGQPESAIKAIRRMVEGNPSFGDPASTSMPSLMRSAKMGGKICPTGSSLELAVQFVECEWNDAIAGYVTHPEGFTIHVPGAPKPQTYTPDGLLIPVIPEKPSQGWTAAYFIEVKSFSYLEKKRAEGDTRYVFDEKKGKWRSPAAEKAAHDIFGFPHVVVTDHDIDHLQAENIDFLYDYTKPSTPKVPREIIENVRGYVASNQGTSFAELLREIDGLTVDRLLTLVVTGAIFVPLDEQDLRETAKVRTYTDSVVAEAHKAILASQDPDAIASRPPVFEQGEEIEIEQVNYDVWRVEGEVIHMRDQAGGSKPFLRPHLLRLHRDGRLKSKGVLSAAEKAVREFFARASIAELAAGMERFRIIEAYVTTEKRRASPGQRYLTPKDRYWLDLARKAKVKHGNAFVGCIDRIRYRGRGAKIQATRESFIQRALKEFYLVPRAPSKGSIYVAYRKMCAKETTDPVSYKTFMKRLKALSEKLVTSKREGGIASEQVAPPHTGQPSLVGSPKYFMHMAQMDEFVFDLATIDPISGRCLGQLWVVVMMDIYTRTVLSFFISFEEPSYAYTTLPTLRICVQRHRKCPSGVLTDNGPAFKEAYAEAAVSMGVRPTWKPKGKARWGSQEERLGGITNQRLAAELPGYTGLRNKHLRVSPGHEPAKHARHTPAEVYALLETYFYETYDNLPHGGLNGRTPRQMRELSLENHGSRQHTKIEPGSVFEILSLPGPLRGDTAKVQPHDGVQQDGLYYWHKKFERSEHIGTRVQIRWDPCDITHVFAYVGGRWEECHCLKLQALKRLSREERCMASVVIRRDRKEHGRHRMQSISEVQETLNRMRKTPEEVTEIRRLQQSACSMVRAIDPIDLGAHEAARDTTSQTGVMDIPGLPNSYVEDDNDE